MSHPEKTYTYQEAYEASLEYFKGSEFSAKVFVDKYALRNNHQELVEKTPDDLHKRQAKEFARVQKKKYKNPLSEKEIFDLLKNYENIIPQGSVSFGIGNPYQRVSLSNCFVVGSPEDSYGGIMKIDHDLVQISKRRGGVGADLTNLRPAGVPTHNAALTSTGVLSWAKRYSNSIREVGQNGRRGALMLSIDITHPFSVTPWDSKVDGVEYTIPIRYEDMSFDISSKYFNPKKIDFTTMKYDRTQVTGANVSLRVTDKFMEAAINDKSFDKQWPIDSKTPDIKETISAKDAFEKIVYSAWQTGEPGFLFWDKIIDESPADCYSDFGFQTVSTNPCGEIPLAEYDSCRLHANNLYGCVVNPFTENAYFSFDRYYEIAKVSQRLMDDLVDLEIEAVQKIIAKVESDPELLETRQAEISLWNKVLEKAEMGRRTGNGVTAVGDVIAALGLRYGSEESKKMISNIMLVHKLACYEASVEMAKELSPFPIWSWEKEKSNPFFKRMAKEQFVTESGKVISGKAIVEEMKKYGRRNIALLTLAPTGSLSVMAKIGENFETSSGVEPRFSVTPYVRKKKGNPGDKNFRSDSVDDTGDHWMHFEMHCSGVKEWMRITGETDWKKSPYSGATANDIDWVSRVELQGEIQKHIDHSISSTVNLPNNIDVETVKQIYITAWKSGCKGITVYRDGCRSGVLVRNESKSKTTIPHTNSPPRPTTLPCDIHRITYKGQKYFVVVGLYGDNKEPYEVFAGSGKIDDSIKSGFITKRGKGKYDVVSSLESDAEVIKDIAFYSTSEEETFNRLVSTALRHGTSILFVVEQLEKSKGDLSGFGKAIARVLKKYIPDGVAVRGESCPDCGSKLIRKEGCVSCSTCSYSKC